MHSFGIKTFVDFCYVRYDRCVTLIFRLHFERKIEIVLDNFRILYKRNILIGSKKI